jgi:hypothetical protein
LNLQAAAAAAPLPAAPRTHSGPLPAGTAAGATTTSTTHFKTICCAAGGQAGCRKTGFTGYIIRVLLYIYFIRVNRIYKKLTGLHGVSVLRVGGL